MKKILALLLALALSLGATCALADDQPLVEIILPGATHGWTAAVTYFADQMAAEMGLNYKVINSADPNEQAGQLEQAITDGAACVVVLPHNEELNDAVQMVLDAGIPVVNFDRKLDAPVTSYVAGDNRSMGVNSAHYIAEKLDGQGKIVVLTCVSSGSVNDDRLGGFLETIADIAPDIEILGQYDTGSFAREDALTVMADVLMANPQIDAVFSMDDETSIGALQAIEEAGRTDIRAITGGGGCQEYFGMMEGSDIAISSALYSPAMIEHCVELAAQIVSGQEVDAQVIIDAQIVDRDNVADYLNPDSPY